LKQFQKGNRSLSFRVFGPRKPMKLTLWTCIFDPAFPVRSESFSHFGTSGRAPGACLEDVARKVSQASRSLPETTAPPLTSHRNSPEPSAFHLANAQEKLQALENRPLGLSGLPAFPGIVRAVHGPRWGGIAPHLASITRLVLSGFPRIPAPGLIGPFFAISKDSARTPRAAGGERSLEPQAPRCG